ncbi:MAG: hypothetical protein ABXS93_09395, partial [Sulfurimonas sp.]
MGQSFVKYANNVVSISSLPKEGEDLQVFVNPLDKIVFPIDLPEATYQLIGGDVVMKLPEAGTTTFVSMGLVAFTENSLHIQFPSASVSLEEILKQIDEIKESPVESVVSDEFVKLDKEFSSEKPQKT